MGTITKKDEILYGLKGDWEITQFDLVNAKVTNQLVDLFNTAVLANYPLPLSGVPDFAIGGSTNYNVFVKDIIYSPILVRRIVFYSDIARNFNQVINHTYKDANGVRINIPRIPSLSVGVNQFQSGIGMLDFHENELILGVNEYFRNFFVRALSTIRIILIYKQIEKSALLSTKVSLVDTLDITKEPVQIVSENDLNSTPFDYIPIISEKAYLKGRKNLISPFDLSSFNGLFEQTKVKKINR